MNDATTGATPQEDDGPAEATVVGRAQDGDIEAFELLARRYQGPLFRLAYRMLGDRGDAEDVLQDTMIQVWRALPGLNDPTVFRSWIYQIGTRRCLSVLRSRSRRPVKPLAGENLSELTYGDSVLPGGHGEDPARLSQDAARRRGLAQALLKLPDDQRACWVLREMHDMSYPEIAYATGLPQSTVRGRLARARTNLAKGMDQWR